MKKQLNQVRRFFARTGAKRLNAATAREVIPASYDDDDTGNRLSGAFIVVLLLHVIALVGVFAFSRMKDTKTAGGNSGDIVPKATSPKPAAAPTVPAFTAPLPEPSPAPEVEATRTVLKEPARIAPATDAGGRVHVVKAGENLTKIAIAFGVRPTDIMTANNLKSDEIKPGQELSIPDTKATRANVETKTPAVKAPEKTIKSNPSTYTVRKNDTIVKISRELGVKYEDFIKLNNIKDPRKIQEGQVLKVPKKG